MHPIDPELAAQIQSLMAKAATLNVLYSAGEGVDLELLHEIVELAADVERRSET